MLQKDCLMFSMTCPLCYFNRWTFVCYFYYYTQKHLVLSDYHTNRQMKWHFLFYPETNLQPLTVLKTVTSKSLAQF